MKIIDLGRPCRVITHSVIPNRRLSELATKIYHQRQKCSPMTTFRLIGSKSVSVYKSIFTLD